MENENLTDPMAIKHALERKLGYGALNKLANNIGVSQPAVSNTINGKRHSRKILLYIANLLGQPVRGVAPDNENILTSEE